MYKPITATIEGRVTITLNHRAAAKMRALLPDDRPNDALYDISSLAVCDERMTVRMLEVYDGPRRIVVITLTDEMRDELGDAFRTAFEKRWPVAIRGRGSDFSDG